MSALNHTDVETVMPPEALRRELLTRGDEISMLPAVANEALQLAKDPDCTTAQFTRVVERDVKLATEILSLSNSAIYSTGAAISNLEQAIVRLGFRQCRNLILASSAASLMKSLPLEQEWIRELLWQHSFTTATACVHLNRALKLGFQGEEFTAGLLHDFGRTLLAVAAGDRYAEADPLDFVEEGDILGYERSLLETDHCEFGAWFAESNGLPEQLIASIRWHHTPEVEHPEQKLIALTAAGDHIANHIQQFDEADGYVAESNRAIGVLGEQGDGRLCEQFVDIAPVLIEEILRDSMEDRLAGASAGSTTEEAP